MSTVRAYHALVISLNAEPKTSAPFSSYTAMPSRARPGLSGHLPGTLKKLRMSAVFGADETSAASLSTLNAQIPLSEIRSRQAVFSRPASASDHIASRVGKPAGGKPGSAKANPDEKSATAADATTLNDNELIGTSFSMETSLQVLKIL